MSQGNKDSQSTGGSGGVGGNSTPTIGNGGGSVGSATDKESLTPSPAGADDVKSEPMELICSNNGDGEQSNDSINEQEMHRHRSSISESKGNLR